MTATPDVLAATSTVAVSLSPQHSVFMHMEVRDAPLRCERLAGHRDRVGAGRDDFVVMPWTPPHLRCTMPDSVVPVVDCPDVSVREQTDYLLELPVETVEADLLDTSAATPSWAAPAREPRRWQRAYADVSLATWHALDARWNAARPVFEREIERVGVGVVRGGVGAVFNTLSPRLRYADGIFHLDERTQFRTEGRRVLLVPALMPAADVLIHSATADVLSIGYPVRDRRADPAVGPDAASDRLAVVLGATRAALLRTLRGPRSVGALAAQLHVTPGAATRLCDTLQKAGLVRRDRRGRSVLITRTDQGTQLLDLLG